MDQEKIGERADIILRAVVISCRCEQTGAGKAGYDYRTDESCRGVTEELKEHDQIEWVQRCNSIRNRAEEIVLSEIVYG